MAIYARNAAIMPVNNTVILSRTLVSTGATDGRDRYAHPVDVTKAQQIAKALAIGIDTDVVRRVLVGRNSRTSEPSPRRG